MIDRAVLVVLASSLAGCTAAQAFIPPEQASRVQRALAHEHRFLRVSVYVTPFFGDATKRLLTANPPDEVMLLNDLDGKPISPGPPEQILPAGTPVEIAGLDYPTSAEMAQRVLLTPRTLIWLRLTARDLKQPGVLVMRPGLQNEAELLREIERLLTSDDPRTRFEQWPESVREAIAAKRAVTEMPAEALEMAWGFPERKRLEFEGASKVEHWHWPAGRRTATLVDGRVRTVSGVVSTPGPSAAGGAQNKQ